MPTCECKTKCYFRKRVYDVGELLVLKEGEKAPNFFELVAPIVEGPKEVLVENMETREPETLAEIQAQELKVDKAGTPSEAGEVKNAASIFDE